MDIPQINRIVREYLRYEAVNVAVELGMPIWEEGLWYVPLESASRCVGTVVLDASGRVLPQFSTSLREIVDVL